MIRFANMKKHIFDIILMAVCLPIFLTGCYSDDSTLDDGSIPDLTIDTSGIGGKIYIGYLEELSLAPVVKRGDETNPDGLEYQWYINEAENSTDCVQLGSERVLDTKISMPIASNYTLFLKVTDPDHDNLEKYVQWSLDVQSSFVDGLLIADTKDESGSDFTLVKNKSLSTNYTRDEIIFRDILSSSSGAKAPLVASLAMITEGYPNPSFSHDNYIMGVDPSGEPFGYNFLNFSRMSDADIYIYKPSASFVSFNHVYQVVITLLSDGSAVVGHRNFCLPLSLPNVSLNPDGNLLLLMPNSGASSCVINYYDKDAGCFVSYDSYFTTPYIMSTTLEGTTPFDPNSVPGKSVVGGSIGIDGNKYVFLMKDDATGEYEIYAIRPSTEETSAGPYLYRAIPAEGKAILDNSVGVAFAEREPVLFVATESGIYSMNYQLEDVQVSSEAKFVPDSGEKITMLKLYRQGAYCVDRSIVGSEVPELPLNCKALIVATQNGSSGKVSVVPMKNLGSGDLDQSSALVYDGFGRIEDVITTHY